MSGTFTTYKVRWRERRCRCGTASTPHRQILVGEKAKPTDSLHLGAQRALGESLGSKRHGYANFMAQIRFSAPRNRLQDVLGVVLDQKGTDEVGFAAELRELMDSLRQS